MSQHARSGEVISFNKKTYELCDYLGEGGFGKVYKAMVCRTEDYFARKSNDVDYCAVKIVDKSRFKYPEEANREIHNVKALNHRNIIRLHDAIEIWGHTGDNKIYLFLEYAKVGDLCDYIKQENITERQEMLFFEAIVCGVEYLHSKGIAHRDLKPQNILLNEHLTIKVADFGVSKKFDQDDLMTSICGSSEYCAPEASDGKEYSGCKADMFSLGIILHNIATKYGVKNMPADLHGLHQRLTSEVADSRPTAKDVLKELDQMLKKF